MKKFIGSLLLLIFGFSISAFATELIDTTKQASITINHSYGDENIPLPKVKCSVYKVASLSNNGYFSITDTFKKYQIDFNKISDETEWYRIADTLDSYVKTEGILPTKEGKTSEDGTVKLSNLDVGLYLVRIDNSIKDNKNLKTKPFLISLPELNDNNQWEYNVDTKSKIEEIEKLKEIKVEKKWLNDDGLNIRPEYINVTLYKDKEKVETVKLNEENGWKYSWNSLDSKFDWTVVEESIPKEYTVSYEKYDGITTINNTYINNDKTSNLDKIEASKPRKTGDMALLLPIAMLGVGGILLFASRKK